MVMQGWGHRVDCGDVDKCFESGECDHIVEGTCKMGGQEHFYLEPHGSIVVPAENDEIKIIASTQVCFLADVTHLTQVVCCVQWLSAMQQPAKKLLT